MVACRHFSGYKPCGKNTQCDARCPSLEIPQVSLLIVHLGALGAVVRATSVLKSIKRKFPSSRVTWVTDRPADQILQGHPLIDRVLTTTESDLLVLSALQFEVGFMIDKSLKAAGVLRRTQVDVVYGFKVEPSTGAILPATAAAEELWQIGLDDHMKFFVNQKPETQLMTEALELEYRRDDYDLPLLGNEAAQIAARRQELLKQSGAKKLVGLNTGCSHVIPHKKLTVATHRELIRRLLANPELGVVLLGGPEDQERNNEIAKDLPVLRTPENMGLRDGYLSIQAMDVVVSGDSLGMHLAIAAKKYVVAWFGPTCAHEIDLYGRGEALLTQAPCAPCWKRTCQKDVMCYDQVPIEDLLRSIEKGLKEGPEIVREPDHSNSISR